MFFVSVNEQGCTCMLVLSRYLLSLDLFLYFYNPPMSNSAFIRI